MFKFSEIEVNFEMKIIYINKPIILHSDNTNSLKISKFIELIC